MTRASSNGAKTTLIVLEAAVKKPMAAAPAIPARVRGRHSAAQNSANSRYQGQLTPLSAISSCATGSSTTARASTARSPAERTMPRAGLEDEQRAAGRDQRPADREGGRRVAQRQIDHELANQPRDELKVPRVRGQHGPRVLQRLDQVDTEVLGIDTVPGRDRGTRDAHQHDQDPQGDHGRQQEHEHAARSSRGPGSAGSGNSSRSTPTARRANGGRCTGACCPKGVCCAEGACCPKGACPASWDGRLCGVGNPDTSRHLAPLTCRKPITDPACGQAASPEP